MATTLVVDGYNAIMASNEGKKVIMKGLKEARDYIVGIANEYARLSGYINQVRVIFDGDDKYRVLEEFDVSRGDTQVFSKTDKCDDEIIKIVKFYSTYNRVIAVSNDNYVRNGCRPFASIMHSEELFISKKKTYDKREKEQKRKINKEVGKMITEEYRQELGL